ncbi:hypothetical protein [Robiginitalea aurantiaca]|uniref:Transporter n=1 Tax=Robiginitalea aurantiaca TaxID=3056915 RepID=A0ABT7WII5_9FLAO|nr:hypothetical protein [Robiginitalea aurantiaca]MDM9632722.1 hypothetical protein [Robiginitalea aurantiaca]
MMKRVFSVILLFLLLIFHATALSQEETHSEMDEENAHQEESNRPIFRVGSQRSWLFRSFLNDPGDDASTLGLEIENYINVGAYNVKNITYFEVNQYPRLIPGQPIGNPETEDQIVGADGINDVLMGFWFSKRGKHHGKHHITGGFAAQLPTATDKTLGSGKWSLGPSFDYEFESGRWFAGAIALQLWSVGGQSDRKDVSLLMIKPFVVYNLAKRFDLIYMPYGISVYWNKPASEAVYLPLGGGAQYQIPLGSETTLNLGAQFFENVIRPTKGTVYDLRFLVEFVF